MRDNNNKTKKKKEKTEQKEILHTKIMEFQVNEEKGIAISLRLLFSNHFKDNLIFSCLFLLAVSLHFF